MKARCTCETCPYCTQWQDEKEHLEGIPADKNYMDDMLSSAAQKKEELSKRLSILRKSVNYMRHQNSRSAEELRVAEAELESRKTHIGSELEKHRQAKKAAKEALRHYQVALEQANQEWQHLQEAKARCEAEAKGCAEMEERIVRCLQLEVERNSCKLKEEKAAAEAAVDQCKKTAQLLECQGLLTSELKEELACITSFVEQIKTREVDSSSEMDASDTADLGSQRSEKLLAADEYKSPEPSLEQCLAAVAEMKVPRALSPFPPSPPRAGRPPPLATHLAPVQLAQSLPALPACEQEPPVLELSQLTCPFEPIQSMPALDPVPTKQGTEYELCKAGQSTTKQDPPTLELPQPKMRRLTRSPIQVDEQLSGGEVPLPSKKPLLSKRQMHHLFFSSSSEEEDEAKEGKNSEQNPLNAFPPCPTEHSATASKAVSGYLPSQGKLGTCDEVVRSPFHVGFNRALSGNPIQAKEGQNMGMECSPVSATIIKAESGNLPSQRMVGTRSVCSPVHAVSNRSLSGNLAQARKGQNLGIVHSPAPATASKATSGSLNEGGQSVSSYSAFLCTQEHVATSRAASLKGETSKVAQGVLGKLAFFATQNEVDPKNLEDCVRKVNRDQLVRGALNYLCECKANPVSAYCRGEQTPPLITRFETLLLQALELKESGWVIFLSALRARFWSRLRPVMLMARASYVRLIGALCCKLNEPTVAHILIWDLLGTTQAPFLVASVVGAWPGLFKAMPPGVLQKTMAYLLLHSPEHTLNSTLVFQAHQVLRMLGPLHGLVNYIPKQLAQELLAPLLSAHTCGDTCVMYHRSLQEICQRSPKILLPWLLEQQLAPQAESLVGSRTTGCLVFLLVSLWKMYKEPPKALQPVFTQLLRRVKSKGVRSKHRHFLRWEGNREVLKMNTRDTQEASTEEPHPQENA